MGEVVRPLKVNILKSHSEKYEQFPRDHLEKLRIKFLISTREVVNILKKISIWKYKQFPRDLLENK